MNEKNNKNKSASKLAGEPEILEKEFGPLKLEIQIHGYACKWFVRYDCDILASGFSVGVDAAVKSADAVANFILREHLDWVRNEKRKNEREILNNARAPADNDDDDVDNTDDSRNKPFVTETTPIDRPVDRLDLIPIAVFPIRSGGIKN